MNLNIGRGSREVISKEIEKITKSLSSYIDKSSLPAEIKPLLFPNSFYSDNDQLLYPLLFKKLFKISGKNDFLHRLSIAGYLYFMHLLYVDKLIDKDDENDELPDSVMLLRESVYHEESLKILFSLFRSNHVFWEYWDVRSKEFLQSILMDSKLNIDADLKWYKQLCISKCAFLKTPVDAFYSIKRDDLNKVVYNSLIAALDDYSVARCMQDDFEDFKKDLIHKKNNWGIIKLNKWFSENKIEIDQNDINLFEKYFYSSGIAEELLIESMNYYNKSIVTFKKYELDLLTLRTESFRNKCNLMIVNIDAYREITFSKLNSTTKTTNNNNIDSSIVLALEYIQSQQKPSGYWAEISNKQGVSNIWATAFISMYLPDVECRQKALNFLKKNKQENFWGYNSYWVYDFDTTNCVMTTLNLTQDKIFEEFLNKAQQKDGGIATYNANSELAELLGIDNFKYIKGWLQSHVCVSALTFYMMCKHKAYEKHNEKFQSLLNYILKNKTKENLWETYWWSSPIYSTVLIQKSLMLYDFESYKSVISDSLKNLFKNQNKNGSFSCDILKKESVFYSAMILDCVSSNTIIFENFKKEANRIKDWLLGQQFINGSFISPYFLLIPDGSVIDAKKIKNWEANLAGGHNVITGEFNNLFSTAVAFNALVNYKNKYDKAG
jgi:hypothetical protein